MKENIFKRVEEKYLVTEKELKSFLKKIEKNIEHDDYFESIICNIYFDTDRNDLIINSIDKPLYKEKVRLRSYGVPKKEDDVFLEIKAKYQDLVGKRRVKMSLNSFYKYLKSGKYDDNNQIMKEIHYKFQYYHLKPYCFVAYDRKSYRGKIEKNLRITVDSNLRSRKENLKLELGDKGKKYFEEKFYIMEIKTLDAMPLWLVKSLSESKIFPTSFSKIGSIYKKGEGILC